MTQNRIRLTFNMMMGHMSTYQSWTCCYVRITEGKIVFQTDLDYKIRSFSLTRISDVELKPC